MPDFNFVKANTKTFKKGLFKNINEIRRVDLKPCSYMKSLVLKTCITIKSNNKWRICVCKFCFEIEGLHVCLWIDKTSKKERKARQKQPIKKCGNNFIHLGTQLSHGAL